MTQTVQRVAGVAIALLVFAFAAPGASAQTFTLDQVLNKMNEVGAAFRTLEASIDRTQVTTLVDDKFVYSGKVFFARKGTAPRIKFEFTKPLETILIDNGKV